ncbi:thymidylate synthase [Listeria phage LIS04]|nr:thymidylate synthase [Listeria phage LIS04]
MRRKLLMAQLSSPKGRVGGSNITDTIRPSVNLVSVTANPVGTLFVLWHGSRHDSTITAEEAEVLYTGGEKAKTPYYTELAKYILECYPEHASEGISHTIKQIAKMNLIANVPSAEAVHFTFSIDNATVALREQMVRSKFASYWTQTSRTADLTQFDANMSDRIGFYGGEEAESTYKDTIQTIRDAYVKLQELGVPVEEIRLSPESRVHRVYWMISARSLLPILSKRLSWIAQATLWSPIISDVASILRDVDPMFAEFFGECEGVTINSDQVTFYKYDNEVEDRYFQRDPQPVDPLWLAHHQVKMPEHTDIGFYDDMKSLYIKLWKDEILDVLGWKRDNPHHLGPYDRPASYWSSIGSDKASHLADTYTPSN